MISDSKKFQSPVPFLIQLKRMIFGTKKPESQIRISFYFIAIVSLLFLIWNTFGAIAIESSDFIKQQKGISIEKIVVLKSEGLGFKSATSFMEHLYTYYSISAILWFVIFIGSILLYRKKSIFNTVILIGIVLYLGLTIFYIGFDFFMEDITTLDKILILSLIITSLVQHNLINNEKKGGSSNLFGDIDDVELIE